MSRLALLSVLTFAAACGGAQAAAYTGGVDGGQGAVSDAAGAGAADDVMATPDAYPDANGAAANDAGVGEAGVGEADAAVLCSQLAAAASVEFADAQAPGLACHADTDCTYVSVIPDGQCIANCGVVASEAGIGAIVDAAAHACAPFRAAQCTPFNSSCPVFLHPPLVCLGGACTAFNVDAQLASPPLIAGQCNIVRVGYTLKGAPSTAPHDLPVMISVSGGTLFADTACTVPVTVTADGVEVTLPGGASNVTLGLVPVRAGTCTFDMRVNGYYAGFAGWTAQ